jgi:hypothetical protein
MVDSATKNVLAGIPLLKTNAGPRDPGWTDRLKEELVSLIQVSREDFEAGLTGAVREEQQGGRQRLVPSGMQQGRDQVRPACNCNKNSRNILKKKRAICFFGAGSRGAGGLANAGRLCH